MINSSIISISTISISISTPRTEELRPAFPHVDFSQAPSWIITSIG